MSSLPETKVPASTVDKNSAKCPSYTSCPYETEYKESAGGALWLDDIDLEYGSSLLDQSRPQAATSTHEFGSPKTVKALEMNSQDMTAAGTALTAGNRSKWDGEERKVEYEMPSAGSSIPDSGVTHRACTGSTRDSTPFRPVARRNKQSGGTGRGVGKARAFTRSQGSVPENGCQSQG